MICHISLNTKREFARIAERYFIMISILVIALNVDLEGIAKAERELLLKNWMKEEKNTLSKGGKIVL